MWLRYNENYLMIYSYCPLDYCQISNDFISITSPNERCANIAVEYCVARIRTISALD